MKSIKYFLVLIVFSFSSCGEDDGPVLTKTDLLTSNEWKLTEGTFDPAIGGINDAFMFLLPCFTDDRFTFNADGSGTFNEGATKCDEADPQSVIFGWMFNADETQLTITGNDSWNIVELTAARFTVSYSQDIDGTVYTFNLTYTPA